MQNWQIATVVKSNSQNDWGFAETKDRKLVYFTSKRATKLDLKSLIEIAPTSRLTLEIPPCAVKIIVGNLMPPGKGGSYPKAECWATVEEWKEARVRMVNAQTKAKETPELPAAEIEAMEEKRRASAAKAAATLARLAKEEAVRQAKRKAAIAANEAKHGKKEKNKAQKKSRAA